MKAAEIQSFGLDGLGLVARPDPKPLQSSEVLVQIKAASLNYRDLMMAKGEYNPRQPLPLIPCSDGAGEVIAVGSEVTDFQKGDKVAGLLPQTWIAGEPLKEHFKHTLGGPLDGMLCEYRVFPESGLIKVPDYLSYEEAATLPCAALTAWRALFVEAQLRPGETVLLQGTGGVALFALQFAKMAGARVVITSSSDEKLERARQMGADQLINYRTTPEWSRGLQVDLILELGGAGTLLESLKAIKQGGQINLIGRLTPGGVNIDPVSIFMRHVRLQGVFVGNKADFQAMNQALKQHQIKPVIDRVFELEQTREAFTCLESAQHMGKIVIKI
ncbi:MAG: NAD(P)-dependent alcohol dehydrogenase [Myxococcaceae bacterium]